ncbi:MAG: carboxymuconolactone decarboxylase family protein [Candidatus Bathyarchaeota archaeon]|nr:carboxymuconolactone decarboxylase family protein [Candidatus Bathyarchaeota archaeon]
MENQLQLNEGRMRLLEKFKQNLPDVMDAEYKFLDLVYQDGALSSKTKRLLALAIALRAGCTNCIISQTKRAIDAGATKVEVLETLAVEVAMSGTTGIAESLRVVKLLEEMGHLD